MAATSSHNCIEEDVLDVIIVGAGPCGLATAARLREQTPAALFTDEEHRRYHWIGKHGSRVPLKNARSGKISNSRNTGHGQYRMLVLDDTDDEWLGRWKKLFSTYDISHLRSPMLWHVDPLDRDALLAHAFFHDKQSEMVEIRNCVGKEISKHAKKKKMAAGKACGSKQDARVAINLRERNDYFTPSQALFCDHCDDVIQRYELGSDMLRKETVLDIDYDVMRGISADDEKLFKVTTNTGTHYARAVVLAVGPANLPKIPGFPSAKLAKSPNLPQACHSMQIREFPDPTVQKLISMKKPTNIAVIGGGLTSAQLTDLAIRKGVTKVWHIMRGPCRVKHFDVDLDWMGKYKNAEQARFWSADSDEERLGIIAAARGGGSVTPLYNKKLKQHITSKRLELRTMTKLVDAIYNEAEGRGTWRLMTDPPVDDLPQMDYIYFATGVQSDFSTLPYLQTMNQKYPVKGYGGFPCLNDDLMWRDGVPLFMVGRLAALRLGPAAPNIGGAKIGAERVAWALDQVIRERVGLDESEDSSDESRGNDLAGYASGHHNMYTALAAQ